MPFSSESVLDLHFRTAEGKCESRKAGVGPSSALIEGWDRHVPSGHSTLTLPVKSEEGMAEGSFHPEIFLSYNSYHILTLFLYVLCILYVHNSLRLWLLTKPRPFDADVTTYTFSQA